MAERSFSECNEMMQSSEILIKNSNENDSKHYNHRRHIDSFNDDRLVDHMKVEIPSVSNIEDSKYPTSNAK